MPDRHPTHDDDSLAFGGWRDWLLAVVGVPLFALGLVTYLAFRAVDYGLFSLPLGLALVALLIGAVAGAWQYRRSRRR